MPLRVAAAITAGELRVSRADKPLIAMLDETKDPDRAIPLIRALGLLEDPGATAGQKVTNQTKEEREREGGIT